MDTIIFILISSVLWAVWTRRQRTGLVLFLVSIAATLLLFNFHVTSRLKLNF